MKPNELLATYNLHDSVIEDIRYVSDRNEVLIRMELCQWKQANYNESKPEMQEGILIFTQVKLFEIEPSSFQINSNEILEIKLNNENKKLEFILTGIDDIGKVSIVSNDIDWKEMNEG